MQFLEREEMEAFIEQNMIGDDVEKIIIPNSEISSASSSFRYINDKEFMYKGMLYDITKKESTGNNTIFYCINDEDEGHLLDELKKHMDRNTDQDNSSNEKSTVFSKNIIKDALPEKYNTIHISVSETLTSFEYTSHLTQQYIPVISPPPKA